MQTKSGRDELAELMTVVLTDLEGIMQRHVGGDDRAEEFLKAIRDVLWLYDYSQCSMCSVVLTTQVDISYSGICEKCEKGCQEREEAKLEGYRAWRKQ
jgi:hypothetical protein